MTSMNTSSPTPPTADLHFADGSPNEAFIRAWNTFLVPKFLRFRWQLTRGAAAHADAHLASFDVQEGHRVLDVGCGFGESLHTLSERVGPTGRVIGLDVGHEYLEIARGELESAGRTNVELLQADAQIHQFDEPFDFIWSRNGTAFFQSPAAAFKNLCGALRPGGYMGLSVWRTVDENSFFCTAKQVALDLLPKPENPETCGPGPFSLANPDRLVRLLEVAGFEEVTIEKSDRLYPVGKNIEDAIDFTLGIGPAGEIIRESGEAGLAAIPEIRRRLNEVFSAHSTDEGVFMPSALWLVRARKAT